MLHLDLAWVDSSEVRFVIQMISFLITLIATQMVLREYKRNPNDFLKNLAISLVLLFIQSGFMLSVFVYSAATSQKLPEIHMPMIDHLLKVSSFLFLTYTVMLSAGVPKEMSNGFRKRNLLALFFLSPISWYFWSLHLLTAPEMQQRFAYFWGDPFYEIWIMMLIFWGCYLVRKSSMRSKNYVATAFVIVSLRQILHISNILLSNNTIPSILVIERLLLVPFFYILILAIHNEILEEIREVNTEKQFLSQQFCDGTIRALVNSLELKDRYTNGHANRVTKYALMIGTELGLSQDELRDLRYGSLLHDIGKIGIHEDILNKQDFLNEAERQAIQKHPIDGSKLVESLEKLKHIVETVRHHHERYDGTGYPFSLAGTVIPLYARIVAVADAYDAMTSDRAYRKALSPLEAISELQAGRGTQFDPRIVDIFVEALI